MSQALHDLSAAQPTTTRPARRNGGFKRNGTPARRDGGARDRLITLGQIISEVGHELRNPLGVIRNSVYFLRMTLSPPDGPVRHHLEIIDRQVDTANAIISGLLDFSRNWTARCIDTPISPVVHDVLETFSVPENVRLVLELPKDLPLAHIDPLATSRILLNLLDNAVDAMPGGGCLRIMGWARAEHVELGISDTGLGIPPESLEEIFQPLVTTKPMGIGLGLTICRHLAQVQGGNITVESRPGRGTTFRLLLPRARGEIAAV